MPIRARRLRAALVIVTLGAILAMPVHVFGAKGTAVSHDVSALIGAVSPGALMAFEATLANGGTSPITHFRFDGSVPGATFVSATAPCVGDGQTTSCELGTLAAGASVKLRFLYDAPTSAGVVTFSGAFSGDAQQGNTNAAKVDTWADTAAVTIDASPDFFGSWQQPHGAQTFPTIGLGGQQQSTVSVPPVGFGYAATLAHIDSAIHCGSLTITGIGQTVELNIANGSVPISGSISYPAGVGQGNVGFVHLDNSGTCWFPPRNCAKNPGFCYDVERTNGRTTLHYQLPSNGSIKGF